MVDEIDRKQHKKMKSIYSRALMRITEKIIMYVVFIESTSHFGIKFNEKK